MTISELHKFLSNFLDENSIDDSALEARFILEHILSVNYSEFILNGSKIASQSDIDRAKSLAQQRVDGMPLQYIIGEWDFMGLTFRVGEGVLIPRPETEILCEYVLDQIAEISSPVIYDLCSGSGCIGLSIKNRRPDAKVILVEKSEQALRYLKENSRNICAENEPDIIKGDILLYNEFSHLPFADVIISNPPYIRSEEIPALQREVQCEPKMALDGGADGLEFYRALVYNWSKKLKVDGFMAFECGEDQSDDITEMFSSICFDSQSIKDYNDIHRIVVGRRTDDVI